MINICSAHDVLKFNECAKYIFYNGLSLMLAVAISVTVRVAYRLLKKSETLPVSYKTCNSIDATIASILFVICGIMSFGGAFLIAQITMSVGYFMVLILSLIILFPAAGYPINYLSVLFSSFILISIRHLGLIILCFLAISFLLLPQLKLFSLHTTFFDLGLYANDLFKYRGDWSSIHHLNFFLPLYAKIYNSIGITISTKVLLFIQSTILLACALLVYKTYGRIIATLFFLSYPIWYTNLFDFHYEHLSVLFLLLFFIFFNQGNLFFSFSAAIILMLTKEIYALTTVMCGFYYIVFFVLNRNAGSLLMPKLKVNYNLFYYGIALMLIGLSYFIHAISLSTNAVPVDGTVNSPQSSIANAIADLFATYFHGFFDRLTDSPKQILMGFAFVLLPIVSFGLLPLFSPIALIVSIPTFVIAIFSSNPLHHSLTSHYSAILLPALCQASFVTLIYKRRELNKYLIALPAVLYFMISPGPLSYLFFSNMSWGYGFRAYLLTNRDYIIKDLLYKNFGSDNRSSISVQNNINHPVLYNRNSISTFQALDVHARSILPDYIIIDTKKPLFLADQSCQYRFSRCTDNQFVDKYNNEVNKIKNYFHVADEYDGFYIYKRALE